MPKKVRVDWKTLPEGYEKYQAYIKYSDEWKSITQKIRERDKVCRCCGRTSDQATLCTHHSTYAHLYHEDEHLEDLILICKNCHLGIHRVKSNINRFKQSRPKKETVKKTKKKANKDNEEVEQ